MLRTGYSFKTAAGQLAEVQDRLVEIGWQTAPIADRCSTYAFVEWTKEAAKRGLRPVYGVELAVSPDPGAPRAPYDYWSFYARDDLRPLHELIAHATSRAGREPALRYDEAVAADLLTVTGPSLLPDLLPPPRDGLWGGLCPATPRATVRALQQAGHPLLARSWNFYPREEDHLLWRTLVRDSSAQTYPMHLLSDYELMVWLARAHGPEVAAAGLVNRDILLAASTAELRKASLLKPPRPKSLRALCLEGAKRTGTNLHDPVYRARLARELKLIAEKNFEDYFFIVADLMRFARGEMIVGPARGSSAGSLVCFLLGITGIDPIPFGLVFERFIDVSRDDLPDIDLDFSRDKREKIFAYVDRTYGAKHAARLGSVNTLDVKGVCALVGGALSIFKPRMAEIVATTDKHNVGDAGAGSSLRTMLAETEVGKKFAADYPGAAAILPRLEWHPSVPSQHAAGIVLTDGAVTDVVAVNQRTGSTMCDKGDAETLNLLKIDALGLIQLSVFERTLELAGKVPLTSTLEEIPLDDQAAFDVLNDGRFAGIFQFDHSTITARLVRTLSESFAQGHSNGQIDSIEDLAVLNAIVRPGPLGSGYADKWLRRRSGQERVSYPHEALKPYLEETLGLIVYQEQIITIAREVGGFDWADATALRKTISRSLGRESFDRYGARWKQHAIERVGLPKELAEATWNDMCRFGQYSFNKSHSLAYAIVSYWCCWLKAHHPLEFAAATLDAQDEPHRQLDLLRELAAEGIGYTAVDPDASEARWRPQDGRLIGPLTNIKGVGSAAVAKVQAAREGWAHWQAMRADEKAVAVATGAVDADLYNGASRWLDLLTPSLRQKIEAAVTPIDSLSPIQDAVRKSPAYADIITKQTAVAELEAGGFGMVVGRVVRLNRKNDNAPEAVERRRGRRYPDGAESLNVFLQDDSGEVLCKIHNRDFIRLAPEILARGVGALWAIKGRVPADFRMIWVEGARHLPEV